jgi:general secretion pathway protein G
MAFPAYGKIKDKVREVRAMEEIRGLEKDINAWTIEKGSLPPGLDVIGRAANTLNDPWGRPYEYHPFPAFAPRFETVGGSANPMNADYDLYSKGVDGDTDVDVGKPVSQDDILRTGDGGFVGLGSALSLLSP